MKNLLIFVVAIITLSAGFYGYYIYSKNNFMLQEFKTTAPLPSWWDDVDIGNVEISSYDELLKYWQSEKRCCTKEEIQYTNRQFFKASYIAIINNMGNPDIVVNAISIMPISYLDYDYFYPLIMFALNNYPDYNKPLHTCTNCMTGDVMASLLEKLKPYTPKNKYQKYINITNYFLKTRGMEMSDYYEARVSMSLARAHQYLWQEDIAIDILTDMLNRYKNNERIGSLGSTLRDAEKMLLTLKQGY